MEAKLFCKFLKILAGRITHVRPDDVPFFLAEFADVSCDTVLSELPCVGIQANSRDHSGRSPSHGQVISVQWLRILSYTVLSAHRKNSLTGWNLEAY